MTLSDRQYQEMRNEAKAIIRKVGVDTGGSNIQFAVEPQTGRRVVIEMNPRVSRSSALASKATGFPIAKIAALLAVGYPLDEIPNDITKKTPACFEPSLDYVVVKIPRWTFEKFPLADPRLTIQMKSVGEAMAIGRTFAEALGKAIRSLEIGRDGLDDGGPALSETDAAREARGADLGAPLPPPAGLSRGADRRQIADAHAHRPVVPGRRGPDGRRGARLRGTASRGALPGGAAPRQAPGPLGPLPRPGDGRREKTRSGRAAGSSALAPVYKTIDTCAAEFEAETPYFYSTYEDENESLRTDKTQGRRPRRRAEPDRPGDRVRLLLRARLLRAVGAGLRDRHDQLQPGDGLDGLRHLGPPLFRAADLRGRLRRSRQREARRRSSSSSAARRPLKLARRARGGGLPDLGHVARVDRPGRGSGPVRRALARARPPAPPHAEARTAGGGASAAAPRIGYPLMVRPSYVLGGRAMAVVFDDAHLTRYMARARRELAGASGVDRPFPRRRHRVRRRRPLRRDGDVDRRHPAAHRGGGDPFGRFLLGAAGLAGAPAAMLDQIREATRRLARALSVRGLVNIQFATQRGALHVLEVESARLAHGSVRVQGDRRADGARGGAAGGGRVARVSEPAARAGSRSTSSSRGPSFPSRSFRAKTRCSARR